MRVASACLIAAGALLAACKSDPAEPLGATRGASANDAWRRGDLTSSRRQYVDALHEDLLASDEAAAVRHVNNAAVLDVYAGRELDAAETLGDALARSTGPTAETDRRRLAMQRAALSLRRRGDADVRAAGAELTDAALAAWVESAAPADRVQYWSLVSAFLLRSRAAVSEALRAAERARGAADSPETRAAAGLSVARAHEAAGARGEARASYQGALDEALEAQHPWLQLAALRGLARVSASAEETTRFARLADELAAELRARR